MSMQAHVDMKKWTVMNTISYKYDSSYIGLQEYCTDAILNLWSSKYKINLIDIDYTSYDDKNLKIEDF